METTINRLIGLIENTIEGENELDRLDLESIINCLSDYKKVIANLRLYKLPPNTNPEYLKEVYIITRLDVVELS
ncbi:MAG: hypothetical protein WAO52_02835 [Prolixibacteraceae bacterium]